MASIQDNHDNDMADSCPRVINSSCPRVISSSFASGDSGQITVNNQTY